MTLATPTRRMPANDEVRSLFADLLGKDVTLEPCAEPAFDDGDGWMSATFVDDEGRVGGACVVDLAFGARAAAALALVPAPVAEESIGAGELEAGLAENLYEITNIASALLNGPSHPHLKLAGLDVGVPDTIRDLVLSASGRRSFTAEVADYGAGTLILFAR